MMQHLSFCLNPDCLNPVNEVQNQFCILCGSPTSVNGKTYPFFYGKYQIQAFLKQNAASREYKAIAPGLSSQSYLIKKIAPISHQPEQLNQYHQAFNQEAPQLLQLNHPNLAKIHDSFSYKKHQIPSLYLIQEWIEGKDLKHLWQALGNFSTKQIRNILIQILSAIQYLHDHSILHLNIQPATIRLETSTGKFILTDLTGINSVACNVPSPGYSAIENIMGFACPASDLYSLGVTCIRLITGGFLEYDRWGNIQRDPLYDAWQGEWKWREYLAQQRIKIDDDLGIVFDRLLQPFVGQRYQTVAQVLTALQPKNMAIPATILSPTTSQNSSSNINKTSLQTQNKQVTVAATRLSQPKAKTKTQTASSAPKNTPKTTVIASSATSIKSKNITPTVVQVNHAFLSLKEDLGRGEKLEMIKIPTGRFDDRQGNMIKINKPFYLSKTPITQAQWLVTMGKNPSFFKGSDYPVECVSWLDCQAFLKKLNQKTGKKYRLPTETEWEYSCRGVQIAQTATTIYYFGDVENKLQEYAWYADNSNNRTQAVGLKKPNPFGLYDMYGNVSEWCEDDWDLNYASPRQQKAHKKNPSPGKVVRGGSWLFPSADCCSAYRSWCASDHKSHDLGLRILLPA